MRAQNLTVCVPYTGCNKNCPYCISKMTGYSKNSGDHLMAQNLKKVRYLAAMAQVTSVLFTGKGEPCWDMDLLLGIMAPFEHLPSELQTNGGMLDKKDINRLHNAGLNVLAFSLDRLEQFDSCSKLAASARKQGIVTRVTLNITNLLPRETTMRGILSLTKKYGYQQLTLRQITIPNNIKTQDKKARDAKAWVLKNVDPTHYDELVNQITHLPQHEIRRLPYGAIVYDIGGISVTSFDYCIQDANNNEDIRSLIFMEDGHVYTAWNSKASILF